MLKTIFAQETKGKAEAQGAVVADALREKQPKLGAMLDASREDVLAYVSFPREHWTQIASTNPLERATARSSAAPTSLASSQMTKSSSAWSARSCSKPMMEWAVARRHMSLESLARITDTPNLRLPAAAA